MLTERGSNARELLRRICAFPAVIVLAVLGALAMSASAQAGTYTIYDCPSYGSDSAGPWQFTGGTTQKTTCSSGLGDFIGLLAAQMPSATNWVLTVTAPQGETLTASSIYWYMAAESSGGTVFSEEWAGGQMLVNTGPPFDARYVPDNHTLPSGSTGIALVIYCSTDDYSNPCEFPSSQTPVLEMLGSALTVSDPTPPTGGITGGGLDGNGPVSATQSISYNSSDSLAGVYTVQLVVDGNVVTTNSYANSCSFTNFQPCPASEPGSLSWDTASVPNGAHEIQLLVTNAAGDTTVVGDHAITTSNSPTFASVPTISGSPAVGQSLTATPGQAESDPAAGTLKKSGRWFRCDSNGGSCTPITNATDASYTVVQEDEGHALRYQETVANNDGSDATESEAFGPIPSAAEKERAEKEKAEKERTEREKAEKEKIEKEKAGSGGSNGANGANGAAGAGGAAGNVTVDVGGSGSNQGVVLLGSSVKWRVSLSVAPRSVRRHTKVRLSGSVSTSPRPGTGKLIYLQARNVSHAWRGRGRTRHRVTVYGKWITFQAFRAKSDGSFSSTYTFKLGGRHTYQFQAVAPAEGQYRNPTGNSSTITVKEI